MATRNRFIPFRWLPGSWGLNGRVFEEAKAHYELDGEDLDRRLLEIRLEPGSVELTKELLKLDKKNGRLSGYEYDLKIAEIDHPELESLERQSAMLAADYEAGKITKLEYEKTLAIAKNEPWVGVVDNGYDNGEGVNGLYFELDWNPQWVVFLKQNGYYGSSDEAIVEQWFADVCRSQADETAEAESQNEPIPFNSARGVINRVRREDGGTEYS